MALELQSVPALRAHGPGAALDARAHVAGYWKPGDGGGGAFTWTSDAASPDDGGTVLVVEPPGQRTGCWKRDVDGGGAVSVRWFGAKGDGQSDDWAAFDAAVHYLPPEPWRSPIAAGVVLVPPGDYWLRQPLAPRRQFALRGTAPALGGAPAARVIADHAGDGLVVAHGAHLADIFLGGSSNALGGTGRGVAAAAGVLIERCTVSSFGGTGIEIAASWRDGQNANGWGIRDTRVNLCFHGLHVVGSDVNAGECSRLDASDNRGWGVLDESFLGNTYVACHAANNGRADYAAYGAFRAGGNPNTRSVFLGCYTEGDHGARVRIDPPSICLGGFAAGSNEGTGATLNGYAGGVWSGALAAQNDGDPACRVVGRLGDKAVPRVAFAFEAADELPYRIQYDAASGWWEYRYGGVAGAPFAFSGRKAAVGYGQVWFQTGFYVGPASFEVKHDVGGGPPTSGAWRRGATIRNILAAPGGYAGWICVEAGAPGVWRPYGKID